MNDSPTFVWTSRPPAEDEPACWSWSIPPVLTMEERKARHEAEQAINTDPNKRLSWGAMQLVLAGGDPRMAEFHQGRCAVCARTGEHLVDDHVHLTGKVRGHLCRSCNTLEGRGDYVIFDNYRETPPAKILGIDQWYTGRGWPHGWWEDWRTAWRLTGNEEWLPPGELEKWCNRPDVAAMGMLGAPIKPRPETCCASCVQLLHEECSRIACFCRHDWPAKAGAL